MRIFWARIASFRHLGLISDPLIVSKFHNETHDPKGQENKIYTKVKGRINPDQAAPSGVSLISVYSVRLVPFHPYTSPWTKKDSLKF